MRLIPTILLALLAAFPAAAQRAPTSLSPHPPWTYAIRGTVIFVDAPAEDVEVNLRDETGEIIAYLYAKWNGVFDFGQQAEGNYWLTIDSPHFASVSHWIRLRDPAIASNLKVVLTPRFNYKDTTVHAVESAELVVVNIPGITPALPPEAIDSYWKGVDHIKDLNLKKAAESFERALTLQPDFYEANLQLGLVRLREGEMQESLRLLQHAAELNSGAARPRRALGEIYFKRMSYGKAIDVLVEARRLGTTFADDAFYLGSSYYKLERFRPAEEELLRAQSLAKYRDGSYLQLYNLYMKTRQPEKALAQLEDYMKFFAAGDTYSDVQKRAKLLRDAIKKAKKGSPAPKKP